MTVKSELDIDGIRDRVGIRDILQELRARGDFLVIEGGLIGEVRSYMDTSSLVPSVIEVSDRGSVLRAQESLKNLQARVDRMMEIQLSVLKVVRALGKLEILARGELGRVGLVNGRTSGNGMKQLITMVLPELGIAQNNWESFERLCGKVLNHLGDAKDTIRLQMKLDEVSNWNRRYSGA